MSDFKSFVKSAPAGRSSLSGLPDDTVSKSADGSHDSLALAALRERGVSKAIANELTSLNIGLAYQGSETKNRIEEFGQQITSLVNSDEFLDELGDEIGPPSSHETEDEFVARAKGRMRALLESKLATRK